jgi:RNA-directed DNA polymerase
MSIYQALLSSSTLEKNDKLRPAQSLEDVIKSAPKMYKVYKIPKRTHGHRIIAHPAKSLKYYQRLLNTILTEILPVHDAACAYRAGKSIKDNAVIHKKSRYLLKMDFVDFFNSIKDTLLMTVLEQQQIVLDEVDKTLLTQLLFWSPKKMDDSKLILSIGRTRMSLIRSSSCLAFV